MAGGKIHDNSITTGSPWFITEQNSLKRATADTDGRLAGTLELLVRALAESLGAEICSICVADKSAGNLIAGASIGLSESYLQAMARMPVGPDGYLDNYDASTESAIIIEDLQTDPRWTGYLKDGKAAGLRAAWSVPITDRDGEAIGRFAFYYRDLRRPDQKEIESAQSHARNAAIAIENAMLCERVETERAQLKSILDQMPDREPADESLRDAEQRYRAFIKQSAEGVWCCNIENPVPTDLAEDEQIEQFYKYGRLAACNNAFVQMYGYERAEEMIGVQLSDLLIRSDPLNIEYLRSFIRSGYCLTDMESRESDKNGNIKYFLNNLVGIVEDGRLICAWGTQRDITARKQVEDALIASEERFSKAFSASPLPKTISTLEEGRYIDANESFLNILGYSREEIIGRTFIETGFWAKDDDRTRLLQVLKERQSVRDMEISFRTKTGKVRMGLLSAEVIELHGSQCILAVTKDITEHKRAEKVQAATYKISEAANSVENLQALFRSIHEIVGELMPADNFFIALYDPDSETLTFPYYVDERDEPPVPRHLGKGLSEYVIRTGKPLQAPPPVLEELAKKGEAELVGAPSVDWFGVPLKTKDKTFGMLAVQSYTEDLKFGEEERNVLLYVSTQVAMAIERKRAEEALRESEQKYRELVENAGDIIYIQDLDGNLTSVNKAAERTLGYTRDELTSMNIAQIIAPDQTQTARQILKRRLIGETVPPYHLDVLTKEGRRVVLELSARLICQDEKPVAIQGVARDITYRMRAEQERSELLVSEQAARAEAEAAHREWQTTFDAMADSVIIVDPNDRLLRANRAFYERMGLVPEDCIGRPARSIVHQISGKFYDVQDCPVCDMRAKAERGAIELPAGVIGNRPIFASIDPIIDGRGKTIAVVQVVRDQTDLYRARDEADRERTILNATIEQMGEGLMLNDERGMVVRANQHAQQIFGFSFDEMRADLDFSLPEGRFSDENGQVVAVEDLPVQTALARQSIIDTRLWYTRLDGERIFLSLTASPFFNNQDQLAGTILLTRDVTEQQREHERTLQADKLRALGQLASGVAHNFNNALAAVIGYTQLVLPKVKGSDVESYLLIVEQSAKDAARMVERIQNFSRGPSRTDAFIRLPLLDIVRDSIEITRPRWRDDAESLGIKFDVKMDWQADESILIEGEPSELREVFVNIILNALDAMPTGGLLTITGVEADAGVNVSFTDTGGGMTEEIKRRIFEPFFTTKGVSGLGMGLSESYRIIERHRGRIEVESLFRERTTFTVILPVAIPLEVGIKKRGEASPIVGAQVLVIDDERYVRGALAAMLTQQGHEVAEANGAEEAFALIKTRKFDIVFTDLAMPKIDGMAAAAEIKERRPKTKIVLVSGYSADKVYERIGDSTLIDAILFKPFRDSDIQRAIKTALGNRRIVMRDA